jgi:hypothetical protein
MVQQAQDFTQDTVLTLMQTSIKNRLHHSHYAKEMKQESKAPSPPCMSLFAVKEIHVVYEAEK